MKLLLTSGGITNPSIAKALFDLVGKKPEDTSLVFIPTAADPEADKSFMEEGMRETKMLGVQMTVYDIKGKTKEQIRNDFAPFDVILVNGGNTFYLLDAVRKSGFDDAIKELLNQGKTYVGVSAGSILAGPSVELAGWDSSWDTNDVGLTDFTGLNLVDFVVAPHYKDKERGLLERKSRDVKYPTLALRNDYAVVVNNEPVVIGGSNFEWFNK